MGWNYNAHLAHTHTVADPWPGFSFLGLAAAQSSFELCSSLAKYQLLSTPSVYRSKVNTHLHPQHHHTGLPATYTCRKPLLLWGSKFTIRGLHVCAYYTTSTNIFAFSQRSAYLKISVFKVYFCIFFYFAESHNLRVKAGMWHYRCHVHTTDQLSALHDRKRKRQTLRKDRRCTWCYTQEWATIDCNQTV